MVLHTECGITSSCAGCLQSGREQPGGSWCTSARPPQGLEGGAAAGSAGEGQREERRMTRERRERGGTGRGMGAAPTGPCLLPTLTPLLLPLCVALPPLCSVESVAAHPYRQTEGMEGPKRILRIQEDVKMAHRRTPTRFNLELFC